MALTDRSAHILLLAGTFEARNLAKQLPEAFPARRITASFAGAVKDLPDLGVPTRTGGFGGTEGLVRFCRDEGVRLIIDATHPFAAQMSRQAAQAASELGISMLRLDRPAWDPVPADTWIRVPSFDLAVQALPEDACAFLAVGRKEIGRFTSRSDLRAVVRMIEPPEHDLPRQWDLILARPPRIAEEEIALFREKDISHVVTKNSGGKRAFAKIEAARQLGLQVIMIDRPELPACRTADSVEAVLEQVSQMLGKCAPGLPQDV